MSLVLFTASIGVYAKLVVTRWFVATTVVLGIFIVLNITLYASDYFTGDGINDAVLYTLTNSLTGAGVGKYILPGLGLVVATVGIFAALAWVLRRRRHRPHHHGYSLLALCGAGLRGCQPRIPSNYRAGKIPVARWRPGLCGLLQRTLEEDRQSQTQLWSISTAKVWSAPILITMLSRT